VIVRRKHLTSTASLMSSCGPIFHCLTFSTASFRCDLPAYLCFTIQDNMGVMMRLKHLTKVRQQRCNGLPLMQACKSQVLGNNYSSKAGIPQLSASTA